MNTTSYLIILLSLLPASILGENLRAGRLGGDDEPLTPEHQRRRMMETLEYWTPERIHSAIPRDLHVTKEKIRRERHRNLKVMDENEYVMPHHFDNPNQFLIKYENNTFMECTVNHEPFEDEDDARRLARPTDKHIYPVRGAVVDTPYVNFIVDVNDRDNDLKEIIFMLKRGRERVQKARFSPELGNGRYTFSMGPFTDGNYRWAVRVKDSQNGRSKKAFDRFRVRLGNDSDEDPPNNTPPSNKPPTTPRPPGNDIIQTPPSTGGQPPSTQTPPTTQAPPPAGRGNIQYIAPAGGETSDPVTFDWSVGYNGVTLVLLILEYPDGSQAYMTRSPTGNGRDSVTLNLDDSGDFRWAIWAQINQGNFEPGDWKPFRVKSGNSGNGPSDAACGESLERYTQRGQDLHKAVGRIMFRFGNANYLCSGTLVEGANDRAIIATAAHCIFDTQSRSFPDYVMFIPGQDDGEGDSSDYNCSNDPHGCFYPTFGVISDEYQRASFANGFQYDYGFFVAPDMDSGPKNGPDRDTFGGAVYKSLTPMGISFQGMNYGQNTYLFGYPGSRDPQFMYTEGRADPSPITNGGWYVECSRLTGGASGGPWTQTDVTTGDMVVASVNSWGWSNGDSGMGSPPYDTGGAECVYNAARSANLNGSHVVAPCPP